MAPVSGSHIEWKPGRFCLVPGHLDYVPAIAAERGSRLGEFETDCEVVGITKRVDYAFVALGAGKAEHLDCELSGAGHGVSPNWCALSLATSGGAVNSLYLFLFPF